MIIGMEEEELRLRTFWNILEEPSSRCHFGSIEVAFQLELLGVTLHHLRKT